MTMYAIFRSEFIRFRKWALTIMLVHLTAAWFAHASGLLYLGGDNLVLRAQWVAALVGGLLFGLLQIGLHKRPSHWAYLIHRPLAPTRIFWGLCSAALCLIVLTLCVPSLLIIGALDALTNQVVDFRHYLFPFQVLGFAFATYLVGAYTQLYPNKAVLISVALLGFVLVLNLYTTPLTTFIPMALVIAWLFYLCSRAFTPDLTTGFSRPGTLFLAAVPIQVGLAFLLIFLQVPFYHLPLLMTGSHPDNRIVEGNYESFRFHMEETDQATFFLDRIEGERARALARQARLGDTAVIAYAGADGRFPRRHNMMLQDNPARFSSPDDQTIWAFSHDRMLFQGYDASSGRHAGWMGRSRFIAQGAAITPDDLFTAVPRIHRGRYIVTLDAVRRINFGDELVEPVFSLPPGENLTGGVTVSEDLAAVTSDQRLYLFDLTDFTRENVNLVPQFVVDHPDGLRPIGQIFSVKLVDGYLLTYIREPSYIEHDIATRTYVVRFGEAPESVGDHHFTNPKHPLPVHFNQFINSPAIAYLNSALFSFITPGQKSPAAGLAQRPVPASIWLIAIGLSVLSASAVLVLSWRIELPRSQQTLWTLMTLVVGLPGLLSFLILADWREPLRGLPSAAGTCAQ